MMVGTMRLLKITQEIGALYVIGNCKFRNQGLYVYMWDVFSPHGQDEHFSTLFLHG